MNSTRKYLKIGKYNYIMQILCDEFISNEIKKKNNDSYNTNFINYVSNS